MVRRRGRFVILVLVRIILILLNEFSRRNFGILFSILLAVDGIITGFTSLSLSVRGHLNSPQKPRTILLGAPTAPFLDTFSSNSRKGRASVSLRVFEMLQTADCALGTLDGGVGFSGTPSATLDRHMLDFVKQLLVRVNLFCLHGLGLLGTAAIATSDAIWLSIRESSGEIKKLGAQFIFGRSYRGCRDWDLLGLATRNFLRRSLWHWLLGTTTWPGSCCGLLERRGFLGLIVVVKLSLLLQFGSFSGLLGPMVYPLLRAVTGTRRGNRFLGFGKFLFRLRSFFLKINRVGFLFGPATAARCYTGVKVAAV